jgi:uncharacterized membrane protein
MKQPGSFALAFMTLIATFCCPAGCRSMTRAAPTAVLTPQSVQGFYEGYLPCADCPGVEYRLTLGGDGTYTESSFYTDRSAGPSIKAGAYTIDGETVVLDKDDAGMKYFSLHPQGLQVLDIHRGPITGALSGQYILTRGMPSRGSPPDKGMVTLLQKKLARGIGFYALGNEPSWSLDIDFDKGMRFKSLTALSELNTPPGRADKTQDADVTRYSAQTETGTLIATVLREECEDTMSRDSFPFHVRVEVKRMADRDYTLFEGCGGYVVDSRLNDIWVLTRLGDRILAAEDFSRGLPVIEFHLQDNRVVGSTGCNRLSGRFEAKGDTVSFGQLVTTRKACPNMAFEHDFLSTITDKTLRYSINGGRLVLTDDKDIILVFAKTD